MEARVAIVAADAERQAAFAHLLERLGVQTVDDGKRPALILAALHELEASAAARLVFALKRHPVLAVGGPGDLPALIAAVRAGALDLAVDPSPEELQSRLRLLPLRARRLAGAGPLPRVAQPQPRVLIIEDDPDIRELLHALLAPSHELLSASSGEEGLERARWEQPDAIILDMMLPQMDGLQVLAELKAASASAQIPVLFLSAQRSEAMRVRCLEMGAKDFITKPFSPEELRARLGMAIEAARVQESLRQLAETDALTGLANFRALRQRLEEEVERARRYHHPLGLIMLDLDFLKEINDRFGHEAGNRALSLVAAAIRGELRQTDFAARYGGDEFVVLLPHSQREETLAITQRLQEAIRTSAVDEMGLCASFGLSVFTPEAPVDARELLDRADAALYRAKALGRDRICQAGGEAGAGAS